MPINAKPVAEQATGVSTTFVTWLKLASAGKADIVTQAEEYAEQEINTPEHLQIQVKRDGKWVDWSEE